MKLSDKDREACERIAVGAEQVNPSPESLIQAYENYQAWVKLEARKEATPAQVRKAVRILVSFADKLSN